MAAENSNETNQEPSILVAPPEDVAIPHIVTGRPPLNIEWCWIPAGLFTMGDDDHVAHESARPVHTLDLDGFWLARYPVTNAQYRHFFMAGGYETSRWWSEAGWDWRQEQSIKQPRYWTDNKWNSERQPVVGASWYEAVAFTRWAAEATGESIRLPTEAQWEKAARGKDGRRYPWGNYSPTDGLCNFDGNVGKTTPVGQYSPAGDGPYGNADLAGNVRELTSSLFKRYPYDADDGREAMAVKGARVVRSGSFNDDHWQARVAYRNPGVVHILRYYGLGFRLSASIVSR